MRVITPYVYGHSFRFCGIDLVLASVHQVRVYASEKPVQDINEDGVKEVTREIIESMKLRKDICLHKSALASKRPKGRAVTCVRFALGRTYFRLWIHDYGLWDSFQMRRSRNNK